MKKIILVLLVLNLAFIGWNFFGQEGTSVQQSDPERPAGALAIITLAEHNSERMLLSARALSAQEELAVGQLLGGFDQLEEAGALLQRLLSLNIGGSLVERTERLSVEYQVQMPGGESLRLALRKVDELASKGVSASVVERRKNNETTLLLGSFTNQQAAIDAQEQIAALGYAAQVVELERTRRNFWVLLDTQALRLVDEAVLEVLRSDFRSLKRL